MIVDDNTYARATITAMLRKLGLTDVVEFASGAAAISRLMDQRFDLMLLDWYMPDMNGAAVLQVIRAPGFGDNGQLSVAVMTAYPSKETLTRAKELGATEMLTKPFTPQQLMQLVARLTATGDNATDISQASDDDDTLLI